MIGPKLFVKEERSNPRPHFHTKTWLDRARKTTHVTQTVYGSVQASNSLDVCHKHVKSTDGTVFLPNKYGPAFEPCFFFFCALRPLSPVSVMV